MWVGRGTATSYNEVSRFATSPDNPLTARGSSCSNAKSSNRTIIPEACCNRSTVGPSLPIVLEDKEPHFKKCERSLVVWLLNKVS